MLDWDDLEQAEEERRRSRAAAARAFPGADCDAVTDIDVPEGRPLRVFLVSDVHVDLQPNQKWLLGCLESLRPHQGGAAFTCLLLPGDVCDGEERFEQVMGALADSFDVICFCFGNHEAWTRGERKGEPAAASSLEKLDRIHRICQAQRVYTSPVRFKRTQGAPLLLLPLWSWYHSSWDDEPDLPAELRLPHDPAARVADYRLCSWGELEGKPGFSFGGSGTSPVLAEHFAARNEAWIAAALKLWAEEGGEVLTFSHFCPRVELVLEKRNTYDPHVARISGSAVLEAQIRRVRPTCHAFGHTHVPWDAVLDGVRYVQWALGNLKERQGQSLSVNQGGLLLLYDDGTWAPIQFTHWGYYYERLAQRSPGCAELAPWVAAHLAAMHPPLVPELSRRGLLKEPDPQDWYAAHFPGGAENNNGAFWARHTTENARWRCAPTAAPPQEFPCGRPGCIVCPFNEEQNAKPSAWWVRAREPLP